MKKSEINNRIRDYILPSHPQYWVNQYVIYRYFGNDYFIKGYVFYSKGDSEMGLRVTWFCMPLLVRKDCIVTTIGEDILNIKQQGFFKKVKESWWDTRKEHQVETFRTLNLAIAEQGETVLSKINTAKDLCSLIKKDMKESIRIYEVVAYSSILFADKKEQDKLLKGLVKEAENERDVDWVHQIKADAQLMLNKEMQEERISLLKTWANETIGHLKLPHIKPFV